ncbi:hypothetical protein AVEN_202107-1 [Araneus ventricosus]|uniref:Uncharacterized protein n=1 Tax=Araneus ventricosus TaxID=182803 RepID=A0A4Y2TNR1_ARAVE|nr:hypothetical protein AVEN_202107-1 [Araneus ventricosus]
MQTPLNSSDPPKGRYYSIPQLTKGASLAKDLATDTGSINRPFHQSSDSANQHHGVAPSVVHFSAIVPPLLGSSSLLKHLSSEPRGVAEELILSDLSNS